MRLGHAITKINLEIARALGIEFPALLSAWYNPEWRWYHGDNQLISDHPDRERRGFPDRWFGLPKPKPAPLNQALRHFDRFAHIRDHAWLTALGQPPHGTLSEMQEAMPEWPHLFAFHVFSALWVSLDDDFERDVLLDAWEAAHIGNACLGRRCGSWAPDS